MQDPLSQRVNIEERRTDANASALVSQAEAELLRWFSDSEESLDERLGALSPEEIRHLLDHVRQIVQHQDAKFTCMLEISSALGTTFHIDDLLKIVVEKTTELMDAERSTLFLVDDETGELWSKIVQGTMNIEIRLKLGQGIAGWVAKTGKSLNIRDAYTDPRFNPKVDEESGYQTRNILCQPIRNLQGEIIGVIQVLNRVSGNFTDEDEYLLSAIAAQAAIAIENSKLYLAAIAQNMELIEIKDKLEHKVAELDMLFELERQISRSKSGEDLFRGVFSKTLELVHAQAAALTLRGDRFHQLFTLIDRSEDWDEPEWSFEQHTIKAGDNIAAEVMTVAEAILWRRGEEEVEGGTMSGDAIEEAIMVTEELLGKSINNFIAVPLMEDEQVLGALEIFNTIEFADDGLVGFSDDDRKIITLVASQLTASIQARRRRDEEEKNERLASIGQMLSGVLHDFKNPMAIISGYVQLMSRADDQEIRQTYASSILKQFDQLNQMTRELLMFARGERNILLRKVFMHKFMEEVRELLEPELRNRNVELEIELEYRNDIKLDQVKMKRAILNLARNAAEAMDTSESPGLFRVVVSKSVDEESGKPELVMALSDNGQGIPPEIRDRLFESFVTQGKKDGTGLGLAIVKKIIEDHEGRIDFETEMGEGTTFFIHLPLERSE
jgi:signal transduction histidine kinase/putative methionine-R-sulfoxide reductase with GAF domain